MSGYWIGQERTGSDEEVCAIALHIMRIKGNVDAEDEDDEQRLLAELAATLVAHRECIIGPPYDDPYCRDADQLAECWACERMLAWERRAPRFECACGALYGLENDGWRGHAFYGLADDGTFDGQVEECACGRELARLQAARRARDASGETVLFE